MLSLAALQCSLVLTGSRAASTSQRAATSMLTQDELKKMVGYKAVDDYVKSGMKIGLGTGSTAAFAVERVGELLKSGAPRRRLPPTFNSDLSHHASKCGVCIISRKT